MEAKLVRARQRVTLMRRSQQALMPSPSCLDSPPQGMMQLCHRESVVQFINEVCEDFGLMTQTAGLAISYFDRFLSKTRGLEKQRVQLLAITCTLIAAKFSETKMPSLDDLCEVAHSKYSKAQLKDMELETLRVLHWELHAVTPHAALEQLAVIMNHTDDQSKTFLEHAEFFIDMSYYVYEVLKFPPLVVASSALLCAWSHLGNQKLIDFHMQHLCVLCGVGENVLLRCNMLLHDYFNATFPTAAEAAERHRAASVTPGRESPDSVMEVCAASTTKMPMKAMGTTERAVPMDEDVPMQGESMKMNGDGAPEYSFTPVR
mmetsp:Transcript_8131/g.16314  ORF Transcript_8131/g.16314 Transcript_8131/m.16314 type:complete len:318 (-) Transcript_8131:320-1273(-)